MFERQIAPAPVRCQLALRSVIDAGSRQASSDPTSHHVLGLLAQTCTSYVTEPGRCPDVRLSAIGISLDWEEDVDPLTPRRDDLNRVFKRGTLPLFSVD